MLYFTVTESVFEFITVNIGTSHRSISMSTYAALLLLAVATVFSRSSAQSTCTNSVHCSCEGTLEKFTICAEEQNATAADPCTRWSGCKSCKDDSKDPSCSTVANHIPRSRRKRQSRRFRRSPQGHYGGDDCSQEIDVPKLGSIRCRFGRGRKTCTGTCLPGYTFEDRGGESEMVLSCVDGHWTSGHSFPNCISGGYCDLEVEGHGWFNCTTGMQGTRCDVFCATRYEGLFHCYPGRPWEPSLPHCVRPKEDPEVTCTDPGIVANADRSNTDGSSSVDRKGYRPGQSVMYTCRQGYALQLHNLITCQTSGSWSSSLPYCTTIRPLVNVTTTKPAVASEETCPDPGQVPNADRLNTDGSQSLGVQDYRPGQSVVYTCRPGYVLHLRSLIICQATGAWSDSLPYCTVFSSPESGVQTANADPGGVVFCSYRPLDNPTNGFLLTSAKEHERRGYTQGTSFELYCNHGYTVQGEQTVTCLSTGKWSSKVGRCEKKPRLEGENDEYCLNLGTTLENGKILYYPNNSSLEGSEYSLEGPQQPPRSRLEYSCNDGYRLEGAPVLTCQWDTGLWSDAPPICVPGDPA